MDDVYIGAPAIINRQGVREVLELKLDAEETKNLHYSANVLKKSDGTFKNNGVKGFDSKSDKINQ